MKPVLRAVAVFACAFIIWRLARWYLGDIYSVLLGFFLTAISIAFVAVLSKAYKNWPN